FKIISVIWILLSLLFCVYGFYESNKIDVNRINIFSSKIKKSSEITIAQISDIHLGVMFNKYRFDIMIEKIMSEKPDLLVITGDLFEDRLFETEYVVSEFNKLNPNFGKFFITGNHDDHIEFSDLKEFLHRSGIINIDNCIHNINENIVLVGSGDDPSWQNNVKTAEKEKRLLEKIDKNKFIIFLKHKPLIPDEILYKFDLMLSGHTHNGQIFPGLLLVKRFYKYISGLYELKNDSYIYVNNGAGTWGPPFRIFSFPEISIIHLKAKK
ncbi:metallophosphoesterase, partial [Candidatus Dependentiae bacterium]|nr:metallophosphoesterase [Candidatus Dependentiae bacterium]